MGFSRHTAARLGLPAEDAEGEILQWEVALRSVGAREPTAPRRIVREVQLAHIGLAHIGLAHHGLIRHDCHGPRGRVPSGSGP